jgi:hypothetical protein
MSPTASPAAAPAAADAAESPPPQGLDVSLGEMLRIMDVARTVRREREQVEQQFSQDELRARLRDRLLASSEITGDVPSPEEVDAAIKLYFDNLHMYRDPPPGLSVWLAHLYVRRNMFATLLAVVLLAGAAVWSLW